MELEFRAFEDGHMKYMRLDTHSRNYAISKFFEWLEDDAIVTQYTGMKDGNGNKIFIGDILTINTGKKYEVVLYDYGVYLVHFNGLKDIDGLPLSWGPLRKVNELSFFCERIGNIYQHY